MSLKNKFYVVKLSVVIAVSLLAILAGERYAVVTATGYPLAILAFGAWGSTLKCHSCGKICLKVRPWRFLMPIDFPDRCSNCGASFIADSAARGNSVQKAPLKQRYLVVRNIVLMLGPVLITLAVITDNVLWAVPWWLILFIFGVWRGMLKCPACGFPCGYRVVWGGLWQSVPIPDKCKNCGTSFIEAGT